MIWKFFGLAYIAFLFDILQDYMHTIFIKYEETKANPEDEVISDIDVCFDFNLRFQINFQIDLNAFFMKNVQTDDEIEEPTDGQLMRSQLKSEGRSKLSTVATHNSHIFVGPNRCDYFGKYDYQGDM